MTEKSRFRHSKATSLSQLVGSLTNPMIRKRRFPSTKIIHDWHLIIGETFANLTTPKKVTYHADRGEPVATLHIDVQGSATAMQLTYLEPVIIEKIATYTGFKCIHRIRIHQTPESVHRKTEPSLPEPKPLSEEQKEQLNKLLSEVEDSELKDALFNLGQHIV